MKQDERAAAWYTVFVALVTIGTLALVAGVKIGRALEQAQERARLQELEKKR